MERTKGSGSEVYIVIAAYNESHSIGKVISSLKKAAYDNIIVVDDGSRDDTFDCALRAGAITLRHVMNRGQGAALKTGIEYALAAGAQVIVTFDADGQHRVQDLPRMIKPVLDGECDITLGSRFLHEVKMPFFRKITLKIGVLVLWLFYGVRMTDAHNGFRAISRRAASLLDITSDRMEHASQIIEDIHRKNIKYKEIPVVIKYTNYSRQHGHGGFMQALTVFSKMLFRKLVN